MPQISMILKIKTVTYGPKALTHKIVNFSFKKKRFSLSKNMKGKETISAILHQEKLPSQRNKVY